MNSDLNIYDTEHACTAHPIMSPEEWRDIYRNAWSLYYTPTHMKTLLRRAAVNGVPLSNLAKYLLTFSTTDRLEQVHPLQRWNLTPQASLRAPARSAARECMDFLAALPLGYNQEAGDTCAHDRSATGVGIRDHARPHRAII